MAEPAVIQKSTPHVNLLLVEMTIAVATIPTLAALIGATAVARAAQDLGQWSEELFRGDRLPLLNFPPAEAIDP